MTCCTRWTWLEKLATITRRGAFAVGKPIDGDPACHANGGTIGFAAESPEAVEAFHKAGVKAGGTAIEDPPGWREGAFGKLYETWYSTVGNGTPVATARKFGEEIGLKLKEAGVDAVILTST